MRQKGSKYARKHLIPQTSVAPNTEPQQLLKNKLSDDNQIIWDILCEPNQFEAKFLALTYPQQILMVVTLHDITKTQNKKNLSPAAVEFVDLAQSHLKKIHRLTDSSIAHGIYQPLADDEKRIIRMDFYGKINKRLEHQLSPLYKFFSRLENRKQAKLSEYNLDDSPSWRVFRQFESFRSITHNVKHFLYKRQINPDALKVMTVSDYCDVIFQTFSSGSANDSAKFISPEKNIRAKLIKNFMRYCGKDFEIQLINKGIDPRCAASLCNAMRRFGHTDINTLSITETHYTPRILKDLTLAEYDVTNIKAGDRIPPAFINELIDKHEERLILARDDKGNLLDKNQLPKLEVHHKHAVRFSANNDYLARANYPDNLLLVESMMHAKYFHLFDQSYKQDQMNQFYSRLNSNSPYMVSIIGFNERDTIYFDYTQSRSFQRRTAEDKHNVVNYLHEMEERMKNEIDIAEKYHIPYSYSAVQNNSRIFKDLSERTNEDSESMKKFSKWLTAQKKAAKENK